MNQEDKKSAIDFLDLMLSGRSIYRWVYTKEINYTPDERYEKYGIYNEEYYTT